MPPEKKEEPVNIAQTKQEPSGLQTFQHDVALAMREGQGSIIKIAVAEDQKKREEIDLRSPSSPVNKKYIVASLFLLLAGLMALGVYYYLNGGKENDETKNEVVEIPSIIRAETHLPIIVAEITPSDFRTKIAELLSGEKAPGKIRDYYFLKTENGNTLTAQEWLKALGTTMPANLLRTFSNKFMYGIYEGSASKIPFAILTTDSYQSTFAGMLTWERTMFDDLYQIFGISIQGANQKLFEGTFSDGTIKNKDARILRDGEGKPALMYLFLDNGTLLITPSSEPIDEVVSRLFAAQIKK